MSFQWLQHDVVTVAVVAAAVVAVAVGLVHHVGCLVHHDRNVCHLVYPGSFGVGRTLDGLDGCVFERPTKKQHNV